MFNSGFGESAEASGCTTGVAGAAGTDSFSTGGAADSAGANGFWYSRGALTISIAVGVYPAAGDCPVCAGLWLGRFPRLSPEPREVPNVAGAAGLSGACGFTVPSADAPDVSGDDISIGLVVKRLPKGRRRLQVSAGARGALLRPDFLAGSNG